YLSTVEPNPSDRYQVDAPATERVIKQNKSIVVTGPKIVFYGTPLELICRASFASSEAKLNPAISLEWYHRGVRRRPSRTRSGGVYISQRWLESNLLESRLLVAWASEADAGQWICLDRSNFPSSSRSTQPTSGSGQVQYQNRQSGSDRNSNSIHLASNTYDTKTKPSVTVNGHTPSFVPASFKRFYDQDILFDRIEVEIVDLPDPTPEPQIAPFSQSMPAFVKLDKPETYAYEPAPHGYGKVETPGILRSSSGSRMHSAAKLSQSSYEQRATTVSHSVLLMAILFRGFCI
ncbi:Immunoglobulin, partial [Fasciola gigantica]